jgi:hypothetical protein
MTFLKRQNYSDRNQLPEPGGSKRRWTTKDHEQTSEADEIIPYLEYIT